MKSTQRIFFGILGAIGIYFGVRQMISGYRQMSGTTETQPQKLVSEPVSFAGFGCSLRVPEGWVKKDAAQGGVMFVAPKSSGFVSNLSINSESYGGTLREYADANVKAVKDAVPTLQIISDTTFATSSSAPSFKISFQHKVKDVDVVQAMYFFDGQPNRKILVTTSSSSSQSAEIGPFFDACLKTLIVPAK